MKLPALPVDDLPRSVPLFVHLVWVGSPPPRYVLGTERRMARAYPSHSVVLWDEQRIVGTPLERVLEEGRKNGIEPRGLSDILRICIVSWHGGWYFDVDLVPLRPLPESTGMLFSDAGSRHRCASNGAFGFPAAHPFLGRAMEIGAEQVRRGVTNEHFTFGPRTFERARIETGVPFAPTIPLVASRKLGRIMESDGEFDLDRLREDYPDSTMVHIAPEPVGGGRSG